MNSTMIETQARHQIAERIAQASAPHLPHTSRRHRLAHTMRRLADRVDA